MSSKVKLAFITLYALAGYLTFDLYYTYGTVVGFSSPDSEHITKLVVSILTGAFWPVAALARLISVIFHF